MDNQKTGALIRRLRKQKNMTQKELADQLHVTDRAVSKWERGVGAPDLALLEPLAGALGISVGELLAGEQAPAARPEEPAEQTVHRVLAYSVRERDADRKAQARKRYRLAALFAVLLAAGLMALWWKGFFHVVGTAHAPDGSWRQTVYRFDAADRFSRREAFTVRTEHRDSDSFYLVSYGGTFENIWWAPDSQKYVTAMHTESGVRLVLSWMEHNSSSNLNAYLTMGVTESELARCGFAPGEEVFPAIAYQFLQWAEDSRSMLIHYRFADAQGVPHTGYFWYDCISGETAAVLELSPRT